MSFIYVCMLFHFFAIRRLLLVPFWFAKSDSKPMKLKQEKSVNNKKPEKTTNEHCARHQRNIPQQTRVLDWT